MTDLKTILTSGAIVSLLGGAGWLNKELYDSVKSNAELKAKEELRQEYDKKYEGVTTELITISTDYAVLKETCGN